MQTCSLFLELPFAVGYGLISVVVCGLLSTTLKPNARARHRFLPETSKSRTRPCHCQCRRPLGLTNDTIRPRCYSATVLHRAPMPNNNKQNFAAHWSASHSDTVRLLPAVHQDKFKSPTTILAGMLMPARMDCVAALTVPFL
jgi:hypothetical protein